MKIFVKNTVTATLLISSCIAHAELVDNGDGTITDTNTGLMWIQNGDTFPGVPIDIATSNVENLVHASHDDWRLPTVAELEQLYAEFTSNGSYNPLPFVNMEIDNYSDWFWSSEIDETTNKPYYFQFDTGTTEIDNYSPWGSMWLYSLPVRKTGYTVTVIGPTSYIDFNNGNHLDINNQGLVTVGRTYVWDKVNGQQNLDPHGWGNALNNNNDVVGDASVWQSNGSYQELQGINGENAYALEINDSGTIVGRSGEHGIFGNGLAVKWDSFGNITQLPGLTSSPSVAKAISNNNITVGKSYISTPPFAVERAVIWDENGSITNLGTAAGDQSWAEDIDSTGTYVVGMSTASPQTCMYYFNNSYCWYPNRPFIWDAENGMVTLGSLGEDNQGQGWATAVNSSGVVVGGSSKVVGNAPVSAFIWQNGVMQDLNDLIPADDAWRLEVAAAINDAGEIVAIQTATDGSYTFRAVLLTP